jgi:hypothetical protein
VSGPLCHQWAGQGRTGGHPDHGLCVCVCVCVCVYVWARPHRGPSRSWFKHCLLHCLLHCPNTVQTLFKYCPDHGPNTVFYTRTFVFLLSSINPSQPHSPPCNTIIISL